ncbi:MAG: hypothetical protein L6R19_24875 [Alphaproteobacteria bacterium]|nr:hypothetical protein [Alphaproteobacteria bacterium]
MAVTGAVAPYALPAGEGGPYALLRGPRVESRVGDDRPAGGAWAARQAVRDHTGSATILEFPDRFAARLDDDVAFYAQSVPRARPVRALSTAPTGAFLAQHIAQELLGDGLFLDPHARAAAAYARGGGLAGGAGPSRLDLAV